MNFFKAWMAESFYSLCTGIAAAGVVGVAYLIDVLPIIL